MLAGDSEFLYTDKTGSIMRYDAATNTETVFVNYTALVSINHILNTGWLKPVSSVSSLQIS